MSWLNHYNKLLSPRFCLIIRRPDLLHDVLLVVVLELELAADHQDAVLVGSLRGPGNVEGVGDGGSGNAVDEKVNVLKLWLNVETLIV